jgi:hypothetical protein
MDWNHINRILESQIVHTLFGAFIGFFLGGLVRVIYDGWVSGFIILFAAVAGAVYGNNRWHKRQSPRNEVTQHPTQASNGDDIQRRLERLEQDDIRRRLERLEKTSSVEPVEAELTDDRQVESEPIDSKPEDSESDISRPVGNNPADFPESRFLFEPLLDSLDSLELPNKLLNVLNRAGVSQIQQATRMSDEELLAIDHFGQASLLELREKLREHRNLESLRRSSKYRCKCGIGGNMGEMCDVCGYTFVSFTRDFS